MDKVSLIDAEIERLQSELDGLLGPSKAELISVFNTEVAPNVIKKVNGTNTIDGVFGESKFSFIKKKTLSFTPDHIWVFDLGGGMRGYMVFYAGIKFVGRRVQCAAGKFNAGDGLDLSKVTTFPVDLSNIPATVGSILGMIQ